MPLKTRISAVFLVLLFAVSLAASCARSGGEVEIKAAQALQTELIPTQLPEPTENAFHRRQTDGRESPYYLYLEKGSFTLTVLKADGTGEYSEVCARYRVSHGGNKTPAGLYILGWREIWHAFSHGDNGYAQYAVIYNPVDDPEGWSGLFIHGPMYRSKDPNDLWPEYYDGAKAIGGENTQGCLRMTAEAARFILNNCPEGTLLEIVNGSPLGTSSDPVPDRKGLLHDPTDTKARPLP